ncbi:MAG: hypothetical protein ABI432_15080 [Flavobacteriales bacterium]
MDMLREGRKSTGLWGADKLAVSPSFLSSPVMRQAWLSSLMAVSAPVLLHAQFEIGASLGGYVYDLSGSSKGSPEHPTFTSSQSFPFTAAVYYRERTGRVANFFSDLSYQRRVFSTHIPSGGLGGGTDKYEDVRLDHIYLTFGPELGSDLFSFRLGLQIGCLAHSSMEGTSNSWSMGSGPSSETLPTSKATDFTGDMRFIFAFRSGVRLGENFGMTIDPFVSIPISSMLKGKDPKILSTDLGLRIGLYRRFDKGGFWKNLRSGAPKKVI